MIQNCSMWQATGVWVMVILSSFAAMEIMSHLSIGATAAKFMRFSQRALRTIRLENASDHWKERALLGYARRLFAASVIFLLLVCAVAVPYVVLIPVDDLNDWIGCLGGHPQTRTPNIDRLAARGVLFENAHCQAPVCNPSRASMMTSLYPATTGLYFLNPGPSQSPAARKNVSMLRRYASEGYMVAGAGKIFHGDQNKEFVPNYAGNMGGFIFSAFLYPSSRRAILWW